MKDISLHLLDITCNSIEAGALTISIEIWDDPVGGVTGFSVLDNGKGINQEILQKITDPFYTTRNTRKVGMGLAILDQNTKQTGGSLTILSTPGTGTSVKAEFIRNHPDTLPQGDLAGVITQLITGNTDIDFSIVVKIAEKEFSISTVGIRNEIGDIPLNNLKIRKMILELISENMNELKKGI